MINSQNPLYRHFSLSKESSQKKENEPQIEKKYALKKQWDRFNLKLIVQDSCCRKLFQNSRDKIYNLGGPIEQ